LFVLAHSIMTRTFPSPVIFSDGQAVRAKDKLFVTMYADSRCTRQVKRKVAHALRDFVPVGKCSAQPGVNGTMAITYTYCHN
jgi:hypothetical protein